MKTLSSTPTRSSSNSAAQAETHEASDYFSPSRLRAAGYERYAPVDTSQAQPVSEKYAFAIRDGITLRLFLWTKCSGDGDYYVFLPRPHDSSINAHASYHRDGRYHVKTHNMAGPNRIMTQQRQRPNAQFSGVENLIDQTITLANVRSIGCAYEEFKFSGAFVADSSQLGSDNCIRVTIDLVSDGMGPNLVPNARVLSGWRFRSSPPFLAFTLYQMPNVA